MAVEESTTLFEGVYQNVRNAAEANLKMQQDVFRQWFTLWPGLPEPQEGWVDKVQDFQLALAYWIHQTFDFWRRDCFESGQYFFDKG